MIPSVKKSYDHGVMFFIMIFSLVSVFGLYNDDIIKQTNDRLASIFIGISISITVNVIVCPVWAGDKLHASLDSNLKCLASSIEGIHIYIERENQLLLNIIIFLIFFMRTHNNISLFYEKMHDFFVY